MKTDRESKRQRPIQSVASSVDFVRKEAPSWRVDYCQTVSCGRSADSLTRTINDFSKSPLRDFSSRSIDYLSNSWQCDNFVSFRRTHKCIFSEDENKSETNRADNDEFFSRRSDCPRVISSRVVCLSRMAAISRAHVCSIIAPFLLCANSSGKYFSTSLAICRGYRTSANRVEERFPSLFFSPFLLSDTQWL